MNVLTYFKTFTLASTLLIGGIANAQRYTDYAESVDKKYALKSIVMMYEGKAIGDAAYFDYNDKLQLREIAAYGLNTAGGEEPILYARNKVKTDDKGRITQIDLYEKPSGVPEAIEPYPHIARIIYEYDKNGKPIKRTVYDAYISLEEPETTATMTYNKDGKEDVLLFWY